MTILAARAIRKSYGGREVVAGIDLELARGECYGLLGPNGAGKTTTLRMLLGLTVPDSGEITLLDHPVPKAAREGRIRVGGSACRGSWNSRRSSRAPTRRSRSCPVA